jgi:hypothetical protein
MNKYFAVTLGTYRSPLTHASRSTTALRASCGGGDPKTALAPLKKWGTGIKVPQFIGGFRGIYNVLLPTRELLKHSLIESAQLHSFQAGRD